MKWTIALVIISIAASSVLGGERTLVGDRTKIDIFFGPTTSLSQVRDDFALYIGARLGCVLNHALLLGAGGHYLANDVEVEDTPGVSNLRMGYGGPVLGYVILSDAVVHACISTLVGGGQIQFRGASSEDHDSEEFFILVPELDVEINITANLRLELGANYRLVRGAELAPIDDEDLEGFSGVVRIKLGSF